MEDVTLEGGLVKSPWLKRISQIAAHFLDSASYFFGSTGHIFHGIAAVVDIRAACLSRRFLLFHAQP